MVDSSWGIGVKENDVAAYLDFVAHHLDFVAHHFVLQSSKYLSEMKLCSPWLQREGIERDLCVHVQVVTCIYRYLTTVMFTSRPVCQSM